MRSAAYLLACVLCMSVALVHGMNAQSRLFERRAASALGASVESGSCNAVLCCPKAAYAGSFVCPHSDGVCCGGTDFCCPGGYRCGVFGGETACLPAPKPVTCGVQPCETFRYKPQLARRVENESPCQNTGCEDWIKPKTLPRHKYEIPLRLTLSKQPMTQTVTESFNPQTGHRHKTTTTVIGDASTQTISQGPAGQPQQQPPAAAPVASTPPPPPPTPPQPQPVVPQPAAQPEPLRPQRKVNHRVEVSIGRPLQMP